MHYLAFRSFPTPPSSPQQALLERLQGELKLTAEQKEKLAPIIADGHEKLEQLRRENSPRMEAIIDEATQKAEPILDEEQRGLLHNLTARVKEFIQKPPSPPAGPFFGPRWHRGPGHFGSPPFPE